MSARQWHAGRGGRGAPDAQRLGAPLDKLKHGAQLRNLGWLFCCALAAGCGAGHLEQHAGEGVERQLSRSVRHASACVQSSRVAANLKTGLVGLEEKRERLVGAVPAPHGSASRHWPRRGPSGTHSGHSSTSLQSSKKSASESWPCDLAMAAKDSGRAMLHVGNERRRRSALGSWRRGGRDLRVPGALAAVGLEQTSQPHHVLLRVAAREVREARGARTARGLRTSYSR